MFFKYESLKKAVRAIAAENPEGFTYRLTSAELVTTGIAVGHEKTQNCFGEAGLETTIDHALYNYGVVGGWKNPDGEMQYDSVRIFTDLPKAVKFGREQKQYAIFDIDNGQEIVL